MKNNCYSVISLDDFFRPFLNTAKHIKNIKTYSKSVKKLARATFSKYITENFHVTHHNTILNNYVHYKMLQENEHNYSKSFFITDPNDTSKIYGLVTLGSIVLRLSNTIPTNIRRKLIPKGISPKKLNTIPVYSIEQVAKNDFISNNPIHGCDILDVGINHIKKAMSSVGGIVAVLTAVMPLDNPGSVISIYAKYGFSKFNTPHPPMADPTSPIKYQPMFLNLM